MAQIHNDQQVYALLGKLFESAVADDVVGARLQKIDAVVQHQFRRPDAIVTMKLVAGEDRVVTTGKTDLRPDVVLVLDAVTGHRVWLGELSAMAALSKGQIRARGPVAKILQVIDAIALVAPRYRAQLDALAEGGEASSEGAEAAAVAESAAAEEVAAEEAAEEAGDEAAAEPEVAAEPETAAAGEPAEPEPAAAAEPAAEPAEPADEPETPAELEASEPETPADAPETS